MVRGQWERGGGGGNCGSTYLFYLGRVHAQKKLSLSGTSLSKQIITSLCSEPWAP